MATNRQNVGKWGGGPGMSLVNAEAAASSENTRAHDCHGYRSSSMPSGDNAGVGAPVPRNRKITAEPSSHPQASSNRTSQTQCNKVYLTQSSAPMNNLAGSPANRGPGDSKPHKGTHVVKVVNVANIQSRTTCNPLTKNMEYGKPTLANQVCHSRSGGQSSSRLMYVVHGSPQTPVSMGQDGAQPVEVRHSGQHGHSVPFRFEKMAKHADCEPCVFTNSSLTLASSSKPSCFPESSAAVIPNRSVKPQARWDRIRTTTLSEKAGGGSECTDSNPASNSRRTTNRLDVNNIKTTKSPASDVSILTGGLTVRGTASGAAWGAKGDTVCSDGQHGQRSSALNESMSASTGRRLGTSVELKASEASEVLISHQGDGGQEGSVTMSGNASEMKNHGASASMCMENVSGRSSVLKSELRASCVEGLLHGQSGGGSGRVHVEPVHGDAIPNIVFAAENEDVLLQRDYRGQLHLLPTAEAGLFPEGEMRTAEQGLLADANSADQSMGFQYDLELSQQRALVGVERDEESSERSLAMATISLEPDNRHLDVSVANPASNEDSMRACHSKGVESPQQQQSHTLMEAIGPHAAPFPGVSPGDDIQGMQESGMVLAAGEGAIRRVRGSQTSWNSQTIHNAATLEEGSFISIPDGGNLDGTIVDSYTYDNKEAFIALMPESSDVTMPTDTVTVTIAPDTKEPTLQETIKRERDKMKKRMVRQDPDYRAKERTKALARMRKSRQDPLYREHERQRDKIRRRVARRQNPDLRDRERKRDRVYKKLHRITPLRPYLAAMGGARVESLVEVEPPMDDFSDADGVVMDPACMDFEVMASGAMDTAAVEEVYQEDEVKTECAEHYGS